VFAEMFINLWVLLQCACAGACVVLWLLWVVPAIRRSDAPLTTDIWGPAALCAPAFWATSLVELNLHPVGESFIAAPILFAALGVGLSLCVGRSNSRSQVRVAERRDCAVASRGTQ